MIKKNSKIFLAGHKGLVGSAVYRQLKEEKFKNIIVIDRKKVDLQNYKQVENFFKNKKIDYMIMAAARAGGILANNTFKKDFFLPSVLDTLLQSLNSLNFNDFSIKPDFTSFSINLSLTSNFDPNLVDVVVNISFV